uniref:Transcription factor GAMYB n=1 Tax=Aegilops tauschii subsp. strangulata TaxID=200361 RepID=A0A453CPV0_AEGTS
MARAPGGAARRRGGRRDGGGEAVRKGPWMAEEDAVLLEHVRTHGPRDWSSIRSKGALQRTGKSCRLRWVNKLRPNLKTGCKFSADEERVVIELQAQFGNKWARIATYLPGRTDNDVKNFWSTRQKRLARLLRAPLRARPSKTRSSNTKASASSLESAMVSTYSVLARIMFRPFATLPAAKASRLHRPWSTRTPRESR